MTYLKNFFHRNKGCVVMIHWNPGWLGSRFNVIIINISVKAYGENEWGSCFRNTEIRPTITVYSLCQIKVLITEVCIPSL